MGVEALTILLLNLPWVAAWLACAYGFGWPLRVWFVGDAEEPAAIQLALGTACMLILTAALGRMGALQFGGNLGAWALLLLGLGLGVQQLRQRAANHHDHALDADPGRLRTASSLALKRMLWLTTAPAVAVLLVASTSAPGWLWRTEFGGYDVMSYHLQLPKQWLALGAVVPLDHNVYSFLPGYVEGAFYHLMTLQGDAISAVYAAQLLHASFAIIAAWLVFRFTLRLTTDHVAGVISAILLLGTPWVIVTGSLAYNEMAVLIMLAGGLLVLREPSLHAWQRGAMIGLLTGAACGSKLTAFGFVAAPLVVLLLMNVPSRTWLKTLAAGAIIGIIALSPYFIGNFTATDNPVFPFATSVFGTGHWSEEQVTIWNDGHRAAGTMTDRVAEAWRQLFRFGLGPNPYENEPWIPQWLILPWLAPASIIALVMSRAHRTWGVKLSIIMLLQFAFWISFTHVKSRFMLPMAIPGTITVALCVRLCLTRPARPMMARNAAIIAMGAGLLIWSSISAAIYAREAGGAPAARIGNGHVLTGHALSPADRETIGRQSLPSVYINHLLPSSARVLFIGEAAPLYYLHKRYEYQTTWDRGPLSHMMDEHPNVAERWRDELRVRGYTHLLVHPVMLRIWERSGWHDPDLTAERVLGFAETHLALEHTWTSGERLYRIE